MNNFYFFLIISFVMSAQEQKINSFFLKGSFKSDYSGYLYMSYNNQKDSCFVINNNFTFRGKLKTQSALASFSIKGKTTAMQSDFYIENKNITVSLSTKESVINDYVITFISVDEIIGTVTSQIQKDFNLFIIKHKNAKNYYGKLYKKVNEIVINNPENTYIFDLLCDLSNDNKLEKNELLKIYKKLNKVNANPSSIKMIEHNLNITHKKKVGDDFVDFQLPNQNNIIISTNQFKGKWFFLDFWSSSCLPCRKQFPSLKIIYKDFKLKNFEIIAISLDQNKQKWIQALEIETPSWINLIETKGVLGKIPVKYGIFSIPSNFLINPQGKIVAKNIEISVLVNFLTKNSAE